MLLTFAQHLQNYLSEEEISLLLTSLEAKRYQGLLLNPIKLSEEDLLLVFPSLVKHPLIANAFIYDPDLISPGKNYLFNAGAYYLQDLSAMLVASFLTSSEEEIIVDLCAAPGGKTVQTALNNPNSIIIANDISGLRAKTLAQNVERFGFDHVLVTNNDAFDIIRKSPTTFDKIILDAPCSGSGMFRKSSAMLNDWSMQKVLTCAEIQKRLIVAAYQKLAPGGELIYSTCSFSYEENEAVISHLLSIENAIVVKLPEDKSFYMSKDIPGAIHLFPYLFEGDGHFICKIAKPGTKQRRLLNKAKTTRFGNYDLDLNVISVNEHYFGARYALKLPFNIVRYGVFLGSVIKGITSYNHHLALYLPKSKAYPLSEAEKDKYLRGETFSNEKITNGYHVVKYNNINLGFIKASNGNIKNHYPKGLRLK